MRLLCRSATICHQGFYERISGYLLRGGDDVGDEIARLERDRDERPKHHFWEDMAASHLLTRLYLMVGRVVDAVAQNSVSLFSEPHSFNGIELWRMIEDVMTDEGRRLDDEMQWTANATDDGISEDVPWPDVADVRDDEALGDVTKAEPEGKEDAQKVAENGDRGGGGDGVKTSKGVEEKSRTSGEKAANQVASNTSKCGLKRPLSTTQEEYQNSDKRTQRQFNDSPMGCLLMYETANAGSEDTLGGGTGGVVIFPPDEDVPGITFPLPPPLTLMEYADFYEQQLIAATEVARCFDLLSRDGGRRRPLIVQAIGMYAEAINLARHLINAVRQLPSTSTTEEPLELIGARQNLWRSRLLACYRRWLDADDSDSTEVLAAFALSMPPVKLAAYIDDMIAFEETWYVGRALAERAAIGFRLQTMLRGNGIPPSLKVNVRECCRQARTAAFDVDSTTLELVGWTMRRVARSDADLREAIEVLEKAVELDQTLDGAYHQLGLAYRSLWMNERPAEEVRRGEDESIDEEDEAAADKLSNQYLVISTVYLEREQALNANYQCLMDMAENLVNLGRRDEARFYTDEACWMKATETADYE